MVFDSAQSGPPFFWTRWYEGPTDWRRFFLAGFQKTWFHGLRRRRARALAHNAKELGASLSAIPTSELQSIGAYWRDFSEALGPRAEDFAAAIAPRPELLAEALGSYAADFARGLDAVAFGRGLGDSARDLLLALGPRSASFVIALGPSAGRFLALLPRPREALAALGAHLVPTLRALGDELPEFIRELGENQSALLEALGPNGLIEILRAPRAAEVLCALQEPDAVFSQLASQSASLLSALGSESDSFVQDLGPLRKRFLKAMGPQIRAFVSQSRRPAPIFAAIAADAEFWGQTLRTDTASFALALGARAPELFSSFDEAGRDRFFQALGSSLGTLARWLDLPEAILIALRDHPERFIQTLDSTELERFASELSPISEGLGRGLGESCAIFARALGDRAPIFARGLGGKTPAFIRGLGGRDLTPPMRGFWATLRRYFVDSMTGNYYATSFLPALSERAQERWFHSLLQASAPRLSPRTVLRCALCHEPFLASEELVRCHVCATLLHRDCLAELAQNRCPNDLSPGSSFIKVRTLPALPSASEDPKDASRLEPEASDSSAASDPESSNSNADEREALIEAEPTIAPADSRAPSPASGDPAHPKTPELISGSPFGEPIEP